LDDLVIRKILKSQNHRGFDLHRYLGLPSPETIAIDLIFILILTFLLISSCAVREAPPGGPEDKTPPKVVSTMPAAGSTAIPTSTAFTITFSKPMNHDATEKAIFLSPVFWNYPTMKWSGEKLTIIPPEKLRSNKTYILTIGSSATDYHNNKMGNSYGFAFSTGAVIDTGSISGAVFSEEKQKIIYDIWAYSLDDTLGLDFWNRIPDYATQVDSTGGFKMTNLGNGRYLMIAIDDKNDDLFWDPSAESMGLPPGIIQLTSEDQVKGLIFRPDRRDTTTAIFSKVDPVNRQRIEVQFSQPPQKKQMLNINSYNIKYIDRDSNLTILGAYQAEEGKLEIETDPLLDGRVYRFIPVNLFTVWDQLFDTAGTRFNGVALPDTVGPKLLSMFPPDRSMGVYEDSVVELTFSQRIKTLGFADAVNVIADSTDTLKFLPILTFPNKVRMRFTKPMPRERNITVILSPHQIFDSFNNPMPDSALSFAFRLAPVDTVGSITAKIEANNVRGLFIGIVTKLDKKEDTYRSTADKLGNLTIDAIMPGDYRFEFFEDADSNGEWSPGMVAPFAPAERFSFIADTLKIRSRWSTDIGEVRLPDFKR
jgi:hypothetical protein